MCHRVLKWMSLGIALLVAPDAALGQEGLRTYTTREAIVKSNAPAAISKSVGARIDNFCVIFDAFYRELGLDKKNDNKIVARLFDTHDEFAEYCRRNTSMEDVPAAFFSPSLNAIVLYNDEGDVYLQQTLFHECSHQFMNRFTYTAPKWVNEGLAEVFEGWRISVDGKLIEKRVSIYDLLTLQEAVRSKKSLSLRELVEMPPEQFMSFRKDHPKLHGYLHYATSWGLVYYCLYGPNESDRKRMTQYFTDLTTKSVGAVFKVDDWDAFEKRFQSAILDLKIEAKDAADHLFIARSALQSGDFSIALIHYEQAVAANPNTPEAAYWLGMCQIRLGNLNAAQVELEKARQSDEKDPRASFLLARMAREAIKPPNLPRAMELSEEASKRVNGKNPVYLMFLAECQAMAGDLKQANVTARKAIKLADEDARPSYEERMKELKKLAKE